MTEITATEEAVITLTIDDQLVAIVRKNGSIKHYKTEEMDFSDYEQLYEVNKNMSKL